MTPSAAENHDFPSIASLAAQAASGSAMLRTLLDNGLDPNGAKARASLPRAVSGGLQLLRPEKFS